ncbi:MAG: hypothetical protein KBC26_00775 [Candidatus Pacebacteria bacterium]|nr:hypothetical protein [Candidatus Paceibacterota bacterium]
MYSAEGGRKPSAHCGFGAIQILKFVNRRLAAGKLAIDFKNPWHFLAEMPAEARREAPSEATNQLWWCLLEKVRTHFEQNPD